ncbi:MAG: DUF4252 domain-containing protein [Bryobacteraceae bacterium]|nr:DUF4252 domain-containing protein [Bryobacteraceae bacterium]
MLFVLAWPLVAQEIDLSIFKGLESKARETSNVDLGPEQMGLLKGFSGLVGGDLGEVTQGLRRVRVYSLEFDKDGMYNLADAESVRAKVRADSKWLSLVSVKEKGGFTEIMTHAGPNGTVDGFLVLAAEPRELTVVNIVGTLDLAKLSKLGGKFGIPKIEVDKDKGKNKDE